ncbi:MAG: hypothetical protein ACXWG8_04615, partial [Usitatibacter sp.]
MQVPQSALEELVRRAVDVAGVPIAWLSFIDAGHEWLRARVGVAFAELPPERSFALQGAGLKRPLFVDDALETDWRNHPLVIAGPRARFIGVIPLVAAD